MPERFTPEEHRSLAGAPADSGVVPDEDAPPPAEGVVGDEEGDEPAG